MKRISNFKKYFLIALLALGVFGCGSKGDSPSEEASPDAEAPSGDSPTADEAANVELTEITSFTKCQGPTPPETKLTEGMWYKEFEGSDGIKRKFIYEFDEDTMFVAALCDGDGIRVRAPVGADALITESTIEIIEDDSWTVTGTGVTGKTISCTTQVPAMPLKTYSFVGPCLKFEGEGGTVEMFAAAKP